MHQQPPAPVTMAYMDVIETKCNYVEFLVGKQKFKIL